MDQKKEIEIEMIVRDRDRIKLNWIGERTEENEIENGVS